VSSSALRPKRLAGVRRSAQTLGGTSGRSRYRKRAPSFWKPALRSTGAECTLRDHATEMFQRLLARNLSAVFGTARGSRTAMAAEHSPPRIHAPRCGHQSSPSARRVGQRKVSQFRQRTANGRAHRGSQSVVSAAGNAQLAPRHQGNGGGTKRTATNRASCRAKRSNKIKSWCRLTLRSSGRPPAERPGREASSGIIRFAARALRRRPPLSSNVRRHLEPVAACEGRTTVLEASASSHGPEYHASRSMSPRLLQRLARKQEPGISGSESSPRTGTVV
jgi:hypothetical protein